MAQSPEAERRRIEILLAMIAWGYFWRGDAERLAARRHLDKAIEVATEQKYWLALARLKAYTGSYWDDEKLLLDAVEDAIKSGDKANEAAAVEHCAAYFGKHGLFGRALGYIERATQIFDDLDEKLAQGDMLAGVGRCYYARAARLDDAFRCALRAREIAEQVNNPRLSAAMPMEAEVFFYKGLWKEVVDVVESGIAPAWTTGAWDIIMWTSAWAAMAYLKLGSRDDAARLMGRAMSEVIPKVGYDFPKIYPLIALGQLQLANDDASSAVETGRHALALAEHSTIPLEQGAAHRSLAQAYEQIGDSAEATAQHRNSIAVLGAIDSPPELAQSLLAYGRFLSKSNAEAGREHLERALTLFVDLDATGWIEEVHIALSAVSFPSIGHPSL
jgi:tetratricopeptide (TPR) repeat protein